MSMERYWIYKEGFLQGPFDVQELATSADYTDALMVCLEGDYRWLPARDVPALRDYRPSNVTASGDYRPAPADSTITDSRASD